MELSSVEGLVDVDAGDDGAVLAEQLRLPLVPIAQIDRAGVTMWTCNPVSLPGGDLAHAPVIATRRRPLWEVTAAGDVTDEHASSFEAEGIPFRRAMSNDQVARAMVLKSTLLDRTTAAFWETRATGVSAHPALIWLTKENGYRDCLWFWNLRALRSLRFDPAPMLLLPDDGVEDWLRVDDVIASVLSRPDEFKPDVVMSSLGCDDGALHKMAELLGLRHHEGEVSSGHRWPTSMRSPPYSYLTRVDYRLWVAFDREYGEPAEQQVHFTAGQGSLRVDSPVAFQSGGNTLLRLRSAAFNRYPRRDHVAGQIVPNGVWRGDQIQIATSCLRHYRLELSLPTSSEVLAEHLRRCTVGYRLSGQGRVATALLERADPSELLSPGLPQAVSALTTPRSRSLEKDLHRLRAEGSSDSDLVELAHTWGSRGPRRYRSAREVRSEVGSHHLEALESLCALGWSERGFETNCQRCGVRTFVPVADTTKVPTCPGCHARTEFTVVGPAIEIFYRLDTYVDQASDQGAVPQAIAAAALISRDPETFVMPGVELELPDGTSTEIDLIAVHGARIATGEVKTSPADFTDSQLEKDVRKSKLVDADVYLMATIYPLPVGRVDMARTMASEVGLELAVLDGDGLIWP